MKQQHQRKSSIGAPPSVSLTQKATSSSSSGGLKLVLRMPKKKSQSTPKPPSPESSDSESESNNDTINTIKNNTSNIDESDAEESKTTITTNDQNSTNNSTKPQKRRNRKRRFRLTDSIAKAKRRADRRAYLAERGGGGDSATPDDDDVTLASINKVVVDEVDVPPSEIPMPTDERLHEYSPMQLFADYILRKLALKDPDQYFAFPVTSAIAPDYATVITTPMDLMTMRQKLDRNEYANVAAIRADVMLIISNAMTYNQPNTVYYVAAQKLSAVEKYLFGEPYLRFAYQSLPYGRLLTADQLGFDPNGTAIAPAVSTTKYNFLSDRKSAADIIEQCRVGNDVASRLAARKANTHLAFINQRADGVTSLNILNGGESMSTTISHLVQPLKEGTPGLSPFVEHRSNLLVPISYLDYGPYASFAPQYDSTWSTLNKSDSDLLLATYGDRANATQAITLRQMVENAGEHLIKTVDDLLDTLTDGEHRKTLQQLSTTTTMQTSTEKQPVDDDLVNTLDSLQTLENHGFDMSFLDLIRKQFGIIDDNSSADENATDRRLGHTATLLDDLHKTQHKRLSQQPPFTLTDVVAPSATEARLADTLADNLKHLVAQVRPCDVTSQSEIRNALGIVDQIDQDDLDVLREFLTDVP